MMLWTVCNVYFCDLMYFLIKIFMQHDFYMNMYSMSNVSIFPTTLMYDVH